MANKMLIDATHPEETRVVVLRGNRVEEFDFETAQRKQLRGNIYLAKVTRVEPSLQAAFIDYGGNRHGFLAFSEIHPDYYQIPVADRQALLDEDARAERDRDDDESESRRGGGGGSGGRRRGRGRHRNRSARRATSSEDKVHGEAPAGTGTAQPFDGQPSDAVTEPAWGFEATPADGTHGETASQSFDGAASPEAVAREAGAQETPSPDTTPQAQLDETPRQLFHGEAMPVAVGETANPVVPAEIGAENPFSPAAETETESPIVAEAPQAVPQEEPPRDPDDDDDDDDDDNGADEDDDEDEDDEDDDEEEEDEPVDTVGGADAMEEAADRTPRVRRQYKIQEVIKRRQIMLVQVVKEERGTKGAALTTYLSLAGRYSVLMPNTARGGGISRKITNNEDRKRLREIAEDLEVPDGMGVILRTAGASRTKPEVKRDFEYLMRLWETIRDLTLRSTAPSLVYEEGSLVKRSIRDLYSKDIEEVVVAGDDAYREAKEFMRMLMPSHAKNVRPYKENQPLFARYQIESQLDAMFSPTVQLKSGGYLVINQTEALVAIDVNSGRSTREHHIEDTALKTNLEASDEVARQLRLRDLAGLIVIDFIDMDEKRNNRAVERRLKEALRNDRARIQVGRISHFGLMEMSRQRIRSSVLESSTEKCPHCGGSGHIRSVSSVALQLLRALDEALQKGATHNLIVRTRPETALYVLNHKRAHLRGLEERYRIAITIDADSSVSGAITYAVDRGEQVMTLEQAQAIAAQFPTAPMPIEDEEDEPIADEAAFDEAPETGAESDSESESDADRENGRRRRRRRRGRGGRNGDGDGEATRDQDNGGQRSFTDETVPEHEVAHLDAYYAETPDSEAPAAESDASGEAKARGSDAESDGDDGEPRRRRRGRRGGRRNRRSREDGTTGSDDESGVEDSFETAAAPVNSASPVEQPHPYEEPGQAYPSAPKMPAAEPLAEVAEPQVPVEAAPAPQPAPEPAPARPARRRSTVREPAPVAASSEPDGSDAPAAPAPASHEAPASEPATAEAQSAEATESNQPRRTGWWARRLLGGGQG